MEDLKSVTYELLDELGDSNHRLGCKCCRFNNGTDLPIPRQLTIEQYKRYGREFATAIFKDWTQLNAIIKRFEGTLQKRWMKKGVKQRREVLLRAWPNMSATHRPDYEHYRSNKQLPRSRTCRSQAFLWPYINLEDLQQRHLLLLFLNSRGRNLPAMFRTIDMKAAHLGEKWKVEVDYDSFDCDDCDDSEHRKCCEAHFVEDHLGSHCMLFEDKHTPTGYGKLVDRSKVFLEARQHKYICYNPAGLLTLEIQRHIYTFLLNCAKLILHDIEPCQFSLAPHQPEPIMPRPCSTDRSSVAAQALEAPYCVPLKPDLDRLRMMVDGRRSSAEDHVWLLQEDPSYFVDSLNEWFEHGDNHHCRKGGSCNHCYTAEAGRMITDAYVRFLFWEDISRRLHEMPSIDAQMRRANQRTVSLATQDENKWSALTEVVYQLRDKPLKLIYDGLFLSPRLRDRYEWDESRLQWILRPKSPQAMHRVDRLFWALLREEQRELHGWHGLIQEIQYMMDTDHEASDYLDGWVTAQVSDLALTSVLLKAIDSMAPWMNEQRAYDMALTRSAVDLAIDRIRSVTGKVILGVKDSCKHAILPKDRTLVDYPADKRPTKDNIDKMRRAEEQLDMFWWSLQDDMKATTKLSLTKVFENRQSHPRTLYRTPAWKEPVQLPTPVTTPQKRTPLAEIDPNISPAIDSPVHKSFDRIHVKEKVKTRGTPAAVDPRSATFVGPMDIDALEKQKNKAKISKKAFRVFCALLPGTEGVIQQRCELSWDELIAAFDAIGFVPEKLYGSVWSFTPRVGEGQVVDVTRPIQFHEPKEVRRGQKIPRPMVRTFGRRLKHAYGWECAEDIFECE